MTNDLKDIEAKIKEIICRELKLDPQTITENTNLREIPGIESIKILRIIVLIEGLYGIELEDQVIFRAETIADIALATQKLLAKDG
jgi:acyl carrier protein